MKPLGQIVALLGVLALVLDQSRLLTGTPTLDAHAGTIGGVLFGIGLAILLVLGARGWTDRDQVRSIDPR